MTRVVKKLEVSDVGQLQALVIDHVDGIEPGLSVLDSRLLLGQATMDIVGLDAAGVFVLIAVGLTADEEMLLRAVEAYSWCLEYPEAIRRLYPAVQVSATCPPRLMFVVDRMPDAFHRKIKQLGFPEVDCVEFRHLEVDGTPAVYFESLARLRRTPFVPLAPAEHPSVPSPATPASRPTGVKLQKMLSVERPTPPREPGQVVSLLRRGSSRVDTPRGPSAPRVEPVTPRIVEAAPAVVPAVVLEAPPASTSATAVAVDFDVVDAPVGELTRTDSDEIRGDLGTLAVAEPVVLDPPTTCGTEPAEPLPSQTMAAAETIAMPASAPEVMERDDAANPPLPALALDEAARPVLELASAPPPAHEDQSVLAVDAAATLAGENAAMPVLELESVPTPAAEELEAAPSLAPDEPVVPALEPESASTAVHEEFVLPTLQLESTPTSPREEPVPVLELESAPTVAAPAPMPAAARASEAEPVASPTPSPFARRTEPKVSFAEVGKDLLKVSPAAKPAEAAVTDMPRATLGDLVADKSAAPEDRTPFAKPTGAFKRPKTIMPPSEPDPNPIGAGRRSTAPVPVVAAPAPVAAAPAPLGAAPAPVAESPAAAAVAPPAVTAAASAEPTTPPATVADASPGFEGLPFANDGVLTRQWMEFLNQMAAGK